MAPISRSQCTLRIVFNSPSSAAPCSHSRRSRYATGDVARSLKLDFTFEILLLPLALFSFAVIFPAFSDAVRHPGFLDCFFDLLRSHAAYGTKSRRSNLHLCVFLQLNCRTECLFHIAAHDDRSVHSHQSTAMTTQDFCQIIAFPAVHDLSGSLVFRNTVRKYCAVHADRKDLLLGDCEGGGSNRVSVDDTHHIRPRAIDAEVDKDL